MNDSELIQKLMMDENDVDSAINRLYGDKNLYISMLKLFLKDKTMSDLNTSIKNRSWDDAFTAVHAMKGLAGNLGFIPLFHSVSGLVICIRTGKLNDIDEKLREVRKNYYSVVSIIEDYFKEKS